MSAFNAAYGFKYGKSLEELRRALDASGPWRWVERDSAWYPEYISTHEAKDGALMKIGIIRTGIGFVVSHAGEDFIVDLLYESPAKDAGKRWQALQRDLVERLLPAVGAANVAPATGFR
jgi:hypothetical protein